MLGHGDIRMSKSTADLNWQGEQAWSAIKSDRRVYLVELFELAAHVVAAVDTAMALLPTRGPEHEFMFVNHEIHRMLLDALGAAARIRALCVERGSSSKQTQLEYKVSVRRAAWLRQEVLEDIDLSVLEDAQVRNTIEHFDEYVDRAALQAYGGEIPLPALIPVDMALTSRNVLSRFAIRGHQPTIYWVRVYVSGERRFINCGHEIDIDAVRSVVVAVKERLTPLLGEQAEREGSRMVLLTASSFSPA
jgi:hypothetical protein